VDGCSIVHPPSAALGYWTFVIAQSLFRREESPAVLARELADLPMLCDLVSQAVVLSGEALLATKSAGERRARLRLMRLHVDFQRVLTRESPFAADDDTGEPPPRLLVIVLGPKWRKLC